MSDWLFIEDDVSDSEDDYVCTLDTKSAVTALEDLHEHPVDRKLSVKSMRKWIKQQDNWLHTPTDSRFLLSFLRMRKFSQILARKALVKYWVARTDYPQWFHNVDVTQPAIQAVLENGSYLSLPERDKLGRHVLLGRPGIIDTSGREYVSDDIIRTGFALSDYFLLDEGTQVNGFVVIMDFTGMAMRHQTFHGMNNLKNNAAIWSKTYPIRTKAVHHYNMGRVAETVFTIARPFLPEKVKKRLFNHSTLVSLYQSIDQSLLPEEYLPDDYKSHNAGPLDLCTEQMRQSISKPEVVEYLKNLSSDKYGVDKYLKPTDDELFQGSFRKINVM